MMPLTNMYAIKLNQLTLAQCYILSNFYTKKATYVGIVMGYCYIHCTLIYCIALSSDCTVVEVAVNSHCTAQWSPLIPSCFLSFFCFKGSLHYVTFFEMFFTLVYIITSYMSTTQCLTFRYIFH